jgi:dTDP-4-dehydrorhamnose reductase
MLQAEDAVTSVYPIEWRGGTIPVGASVIRLSWLYGPEIQTAPMMVAQAQLQEQVYSDLQFSPTFVGEAAFLIARNIIESPQTLARTFIHAASPADPISWYDLLEPAGDKIGAVRYQDLPMAQSVNLGVYSGLTPTKGWFLPADYQKGLKEMQLEIEQNRWVHYW